ncbi:MAG: SUMF1/EgtB/PvdO family nonheme iron enzyme [Oscillatoria princeps RMCB-10]|nr:SUMF1/EgtB/PvdO family nonheme iron enzyme [Oscillatoria princeps RMCB-10]
MTFKSINSRDAIRNALQECRTGTLKLFEGMDDATFRQQAHPDFSPPGWHLGHIAYTEALWLLQRSAGYPPVFPEYHRLLAADGLPKAERVRLPNLAELRHYQDTVREKVLDYLEIAPVQEQERLWSFIVQHESQHCETVTFLSRLAGWQGISSQQGRILAPDAPRPVPGALSEMIEIPAGEFERGSDSTDALDNERPAHRHYLDTYWIDRYPVTCGQYRQFIAAGGYHNSSFWSSEGWEWRQNNSIRQPLYWSDDSRFDSHPVCGVSWYEADAFARFAGKRLPAEAEWEKAVCWDASAGSRRTYPWGEEPPDASRCNHDNLYAQTTPAGAFPAGASFWGVCDALGNVWEWTSSWFEGYEGFELYPYAGYSQAYFDRQHRVLKGGSWATRPRALRGSFRNWYQPWVRQLFAGFRCAR